MKFTFKKQPRETGLASVGNPYPDTDIKLNKKIVGQIVAPNWASKDGLWYIRLTRKKEGGWLWVQIKQKFESEPEAREWLQTNAEKVIALDLHSEEPD
jgi:hypothetical protein